ncbi:hypothetical protein [Geobacter sp. DSM 9736]|uniref:hypothetical protein n=1 Tax=Geobacter sp. DSM 9736 TaxID=1277350 RepID=UPI000B50D65C|nr:hypothetical protein [Geobacter sp. DSM 9736]SNB46569.1 hypothetical protein SAMN06269301_2037 [Geobacter sp. DSM 9736]
MKWHALLLVLPMLTAGCQRNSLMETRKKYDEAIETVKESESNLPGVDTATVLDVVFSSLAAEGHAILPQGWTCTYRDNRYFIWYSLRINDRLVKFHWIVAGKDIIVPANDLTRTVTKVSRQW